MEVRNTALGKGPYVLRSPFQRMLKLPWSRLNDSATLLWWPRSSPCWAVVQKWKQKSNAQWQWNLVCGSWEKMQVPRAREWSPQRCHSGRIFWKQWNSSGMPDLVLLCSFHSRWRPLGVSCHPSHKEATREMEWQPGAPLATVWTPQSALPSLRPSPPPPLVPSPHIVKNRRNDSAVASNFFLNGTVKKKEVIWPKNTDSVF